MKVDMSPRAVKGRLELVGQLWRLGVLLDKAKRETDAHRNGNEIASDWTEKENSRNKEKLNENIGK